MLATLTFLLLPPTDAGAADTLRPDQPPDLTDQLRGALSALHEKYRKLRNDVKDQQRGRGASHDGDAGAMSLRLDLQLATRRAQDAEEKAAALKRELEEERRSSEAGHRAMMEARMRVRCTPLSL